MNNELMIPGIDRIARERWRQINTEGYTSDHDDLHDNGEIAIAAACYASPENIYICEHRQNSVIFLNPWPWDDADDKRPRIADRFAVDAKAASDEQRIDLLIKAGALIAAEIDRIQRAMALRESR